MAFGIVGADNGATASVIGNTAQHLVAAEADAAERTRIDHVDGDIAAIGGLHGLLQQGVVGTAGPHGRPLAEEQDRLAAFAQAAELGSKRAERGQGNAGAQFHPVALGQLQFFNRALDRERLVATPLEGADTVEQIRLRPGVCQVAQAFERFHDHGQVVRTELFDEATDRFTEWQCDLGSLVDVVVVQEDAEQPHVFARGFQQRMLARADLKRLVQVAGAVAGDARQLHVLHHLRHAVLGDLEVSQPQIGDRLIVIGHRDVDANQVGAGAEDRLLYRLIGGGHHGTGQQPGQKRSVPQCHQPILYSMRMGEPWRRWDVYRLPGSPIADSPTAKMRITSYAVSCGGQMATATSSAPGASPPSSAAPTLAEVQRLMAEAPTLR